MAKFSTPPDEEHRVRTVRSLRLFEAHRLPRFGASLRLAALAARVPSAFIGLVDREQEKIVASHRFELTDIPREHSFCTHALLERELLVVQDARFDARFADNPFVTGHPFIRFCAAAPLRVGQHAVGALCVFQDEPRALSSVRRRQLRLTADQVQETLELHRRCALVEAHQNTTTSVVLDRELRVTHATGPSSSRLAGQPYPRFIHPDDRARLQQLLDRASVHTPTREQLRLLADESGSEDEITVSATRTHGNDGFLLDVWSTSTPRPPTDDPHVRHRELTAALLHDAKGPLTSVLINAEFALEAPRASEDKDDLLRDVIDAANVMRSMLQDLLDFQRLPTEAMHFREALNLEELAEEARRQSAPLTAQKKQTVDISMGEPLPVLADRNIMLRVIRNLLENASKYSPEGSRIEVSGALAENEVCLSVRDEGPGIPEEHQSEIFDPYVRLGGHSDTWSRGLGLAFCKDAVEAHEGSIEVENVHGNTGSRFTIRLPRLP